MIFLRITMGFIFMMYSFQGLTQKEATKQDHSKVEKLHNAQSYGAAIDQFNQELITTDASTPARLLAESYRLTGNTYSAEHWYGVIVKGDNALPQDKLYYAQMLQSNEKYKEAELWFLEYNKAIGNDKNTGIRLAENCKNASSSLIDDDVIIRNMEELNSDKLEFSPMFYKTGLVFTSTRKPIQSLTNRTDLWTNENFMHLFFAEVSADDISIGKVSRFNSFNDKFHDGTASFSPNQKTMYFARSNSKKKGRRKKDDSGVTRLKIYQVQKIKDEWEDIQELPFNQDEFDSCHPAVSRNGSILYFSSDRPGGFGGMDLYKCEKIGSSWGNPENLGSKINTEGNEIFPFIHPDGTLYFASNGLPGIGGLDIFSSIELADENFEKMWTKPKNLGKPINTSQDDFSLIVDITGTKGYFSSNREGGKGLDDIYSFLCKKGIQNLGNSIAKSTIVSTEFCVVDFNSDEPIGNVNVEIIPILNNNMLGEESTENEFTVELKPVEGSADKYSLQLVKRKGDGSLSADNQFVTNKFGVCSASFSPELKYEIVLTKIGYEKLSFEFTYDEFLKNNKNCFAIKQLDCVKLEGKVVNKNYENGLANSTITIFNKCSGEIEKLTTDKSGDFEFCMECDCDYEVLASKQYFSMDMQVAKDFDCDSIVKMNFYLMTKSENLMSMNDKMNNPNNAPTGYSSEMGSSSNANPITINNFNYSLPSNMATENLKVGTKMELKNIFYDFNQVNIREDAKPELENVVKLLQMYPSMKVELQSHTDARGKRKYNQKLSQGRANEAVKYIVKRGINASRIIGVGYGENVLKNNCFDGVDCSEEEHQKNRRTEIKVISLGSSNIDVKYIDNEPKIIDSPNGRISSDF